MSVLHSLFALDQLELAIAPNTAPSPTPTTPAAPRMMPPRRCPLPVCELCGVVLSTGSGARGVGEAAVAKVKTTRSRRPFSFSWMT